NVPYQKYDYIEIGNMKGIVTTTPNATTGTQGQAVALTDAIASAYCSTGPTISVSDQLVKDALVVNGGAETTSRKGFYIPLDATGGVCASTMEFPVEVTPLPTPTISQANNYTELTCSRTSITLTANGNGGTFAWSGGGTGSSKTVSTAGTYTVTETKNGCQGTSEGYVISSNTTKPDKPTGASSNAYCGTSNAVFSVSAPSSPLTIDWYSSESGGSPVWTGESSHTVNGLSSTATYYAVTRNTNTGCVSTSRTGVTSTINSIPTPTISQSNNYHELTCSRTIITLTANGSGGTFAWSGGGTSSTKDVTTAGPYTVTETKNGCSGTSDEYTITSNTTAPTVSVTGTNEICLGESTTLHTTSNANYTYLWSNSVETYNNTVSPNTTTTYSVTTTDSRNNCSATASRTVTVKTPNIDASSYDYIWRGVSTDWNTVSNWYVYNSGYSVATELPTTAKNIYIGTGLCLTSSNWPSQTGEANANNITIASGASLTILASKTLNIAGSITNNGTFTANNSSTIVFKGSATQTLSSAMTFGNVTFAQTALDTIKAPNGITVNGTATFNKGIVMGEMTFNAGATAANVTDSASFVAGKVKKLTGASAETNFTFPTGSAGEGQPKVLGSIKVASLPANSETYAVFSQKSNGGGFSESEMPRWWNQNNNCEGNDPLFDHISNFEFWNVSTNSALTADITVSANNRNAHFSPDAVSYDGEDIFGAMWQGGCWKKVSDHAVVSDPKTITISGVTIPAVSTRASEPQWLSLGSKNHETLLPIELVSFSATCDGRSALVEWTTATEKNNDYF
ncbi:MAG: hypothetical protein II575_09615, partial [Bacteroidales bacterium]|nr:hypothetical protein [Bacteroidales bacterium]